MLPIIGSTFPLIASKIKEEYSGGLVTAILLTCQSIVAGLVAYSVYSRGPILYGVGGESLSRPEGFAIGVELLADEFSAILVLLASLITLSTVIYAVRISSRSPTFLSGVLLLIGGIMGVLMTHDVFNLFVFLEITGIATYALIASGKSKESSLTSFKYLLIGTTGASLYLLGVGFLYMTTGTLNISDLSTVLAGEGFIDEPLYGNPLVQLSFAFISTGLLIKCAIFPLHTWQPDAYDYAPHSITALIAALVSTASAYVFGRLLFNVYTPEFFVANPLAAEIIIIVSGLSVVAGSVLAVMQENIKRMLAYSSVSHFGLILAAFAAAVQPSGSIEALIGGIIHLTGHGLVKAGMFFGAGLLIIYTGSKNIHDFRGLGEKLRGVSGSVSLMGIVLIGVPPSIGFLGKWYIVLGAIKSEMWVLAGLVLFSTLLTLMYVAKLVETLFFSNKESSGSRVKIYRVLVLIPVFFALLSVLLGFTGSAWFDGLMPFAEEVMNK